MKTFLVALILLVVLAAYALVVVRKRGPLTGLTGEWPFFAKRPLSQPEQVLYHRLVKAVPAWLYKAVNVCLWGKQLVSAAAVWLLVLLGKALT